MEGDSGVCGGREKDSDPEGVGGVVAFSDTASAVLVGVGATLPLNRLRPELEVDDR